jgi:hypothetical protein
MVHGKEGDREEVQTWVFATNAYDSLPLHVITSWKLNLFKMIRSLIHTREKVRVMITFA